MQNMWYMGTHREDTFHLQKLALVQAYIEKHPKEAKKLAQEYLRVNSKSLKQGVVRSLLSLPGVHNDNLQDIAHELDIPMIDISDSE